MLISGTPDSISEDFSITTSGENILWESPSLIANDLEHYEMLYTVNSASVYVSYGGFDFGPFDVTDMIPPESIVTWQPSSGPAPLDFMWHEVVTPEDQTPPSLAYNWITEIDGTGVVTWRGEDVYLGEAEYDLGWPFGVVLVQIEEGTINANLEIYKVVNPCYEDIDANGSVDVSDLLIVIDNWGGCPDCVDEIPGDVNYDNLVDVTDLLRVVASWGPCI
jgi:hypothetical protein